MTNLIPEFGIYSTKILTETGFFEGTIVVKNGVITKLIAGKLQNQNFPIENLSDSVVMPGLIDSHVHINEPGRTEWEGFESITKAAIAGGITTLVDMPLNASPVTTSVEAFQLKLNATKGKLHCNVGFWGGIIPNNSLALDSLLQAGVFGIKAFLAPSGIDEFSNVSFEDLQKGVEALKKHGLPLLVHAELEKEHPGLVALENNPSNYLAYLQSRPRSWEDEAIDLLIKFCETNKTPVHIVHLSSTNSLKKIKTAREKGLPLTVETCPHYLYFWAEMIPNGNPLFKCAPPIREQENNEKLWGALKEGTIDFIVTDHSPAPPALKELETGNLQQAWGGISSLQFSLAVLWTAACKRNFSIEEVSALMSSKVAKFLGLENSKGKIKIGYDADILVWDPYEKFTVKKEDTYFRHKISPYMGETLQGVVKQTYVGGVKVFDRGKIVSSATCQVLLKNTKTIA
jgi:allantoinase